MRYLIKLTPLNPFFFGGDVTFGKKGDKEKGTYLVKSRHFPQQSAVLGMVRKELLIQKGFLTTKVRGEWIDNNKKDEAKRFVGNNKFEFDKEQDFGVLKSISPIFLIRGDDKFIKKVDIDSYNYRDGLLEGYNPKENIYDNFISISSGEKKSTNDIFKSIEQIGNSKFDDESSFFKKTSYLLKDDFNFAFYIDCDYRLKDSIITLGGEKSTFKMTIIEDSSELDYQSKKDCLTLLSDAYITLPIKEHSAFAITSEISFNYLQNEFKDNRRTFKKSPKSRFLYERGSIFIEPSNELIDSLNNKNLQKIGYNIYTIGENR